MFAFVATRDRRTIERTTIAVDAQTHCSLYVNRMSRTKPRMIMIIDNIEHPVRKCLLETPRHNTARMSSVGVTDYHDALTRRNPYHSSNTK